MKNMTKMFQIIKGFSLVDGLDIKAHKTFKGHAGETLSQGNIYFEGKKIGFIAEDYSNGETQLDINKGKKEAYEKLEALILAGNFKYSYPDGSEIEVTPLTYLTEVIIMTRVYLMVKKASKKETTTYNTKRRSYGGITAPYTDEHKGEIDKLLKEGDIVLDIYL